MSKSRDRRRRHERRTRRRWHPAFANLNPAADIDRLIHMISRRPERRTR